MDRQSDFQWGPCTLSGYITIQVVLCMFTPKFHPYLSFVQRAWGQGKWFLHLFCYYSFPDLKSRLAIALELQKISREHGASHEKLGAD